MSVKSSGICGLELESVIGGLGKDVITIESFVRHNTSEGFMEYEEILRFYLDGFKDVDLGLGVRGFPIFSKGSVIDGDGNYTNRGGSYLGVPTSGVILVEGSIGIEPDMLDSLGVHYTFEEGSLWLHLYKLLRTSPIVKYLWDSFDYIPNIDYIMTLDNVYFYNISDNVDFKDSLNKALEILLLNIHSITSSFYSTIGQDLFYNKKSPVVSMIPLPNFSQSIPVSNLRLDGPSPTVERVLPIPFPIDEITEDVALDIVTNFVNADKDNLKIVGGVYLIVITTSTGYLRFILDTNKLD